MKKAGKDPTFNVAAFLAVRHDEERVVKTAYTPQLLRPCMRRRVDGSLPEANQENRRFLFFTTFWQEFTAFPPARALLHLWGDAHFDIVGKSSQPFKYLAS